MQRRTRPLIFVNAVLFVVVACLAQLGPPPGGTGSPGSASRGSSPSSSMPRS